jgi:DNA-binding transcriptional LysR family regulator
MTPANRPLTARDIVMSVAKRPYSHLIARLDKLIGNWNSLVPWDNQTKRRLKLRELDILMAVVKMGGMRKAADHLHMSQPTVSKAIADLERTLGVPLLDRSPQGVEATQYGRALLDCGMAVFDDLRQGIKNIEFLADPTVGEIRIGSNEALIAGLLPAVFGRLRRQRPGISIHVKPVSILAHQYLELRDRKVDLIVGRIPESIEEDVTADALFRERTFVVAGLKNKWAHRRKIELSELADEPWSLPSPETLVGSLVADAFRASGLQFPPKGAALGTLHLFCALLARESFLAVVPGSLLQFGSMPPLKVLPVNLPLPAWPVGLLTLKNRTLSPAVQLFIDCAREVAKPLAKHEA